MKEKEYLIELLNGERVIEEAVCPSIAIENVCKKYNCQYIWKISCLN